MTTPDAITIQKLLADFSAKGAKFAVMEATSHSLVQGRVNGVDFDIAVYTNLSRDHLDYHGDMASYANAKRLNFLINRAWITWCSMPMILTVSSGCRSCKPEKNYPCLLIRSKGHEAQASNVRAITVQHAQFTDGGITASIYTSVGRWCFA